ncbi:SDR family NAD(P)-dependent oxidoreductase [Sporosarcina highlanderae]|uniref:SDR family NAD(P)-dependent oxidoreductase n=1 Tax=Sporosarcina highlanderae TaxID=3035916 RepID=A0ABT8JVH3_9BACL|nr:SDR family NAD(P)-dependent oxidoreductase [Sporosarcina highlanderae]MDN4609174.1 SDR family NAD(P)-dependent oxidoreductase [Sporosarcina highlanderae]
MNDYFRINGTTAVVTGGANGLGYEYAKALLKQNLKVIICDINENEVQLAIGNLKEFGHIFGDVVNVTSEFEVSNWVKKIVIEHGRVDYLVNNAGVVQRKTIAEMDGTEWDRVMDVNVKGTFLCSKYFAEEMVNQRSGKIINVSSIAGRKAMDLRLAYCTSKASIEHFTRTLARELGASNIRVNAIAPGYISTRMNEDMRNDPIIYGDVVNSIPLGDFGSSDDLIGTLLFLISSASDYITGQTIFVDGGVITA